MRANDLTAIATEARRASTRSLKRAIDHLDAVAAGGTAFGSTVRFFTTLLENENWPWYGPLDRLASRRWVQATADLSAGDAEKLRRLSRGLSVPDAQLVATDTLDRAALRWFTDGPGPALYAAMNERSVRVFFRKVREQEPRLYADVVRLANAEAKRVGAPTPLPRLTFWGGHGHENLM